MSKYVIINMYYRGGFMYIDAVIVIALILIALCWFRSFPKFIYAFAIIDIFLRLIDWIADHIGIPGFNHWVDRIFPNSIKAIIETYTTGIVETILVWIYIIFMVIFLFYTIRVFIRKK